HPPGRDRQLHGRGALRAEAPLLDGAGRGALYLEKLRVALLILARICDEAAADGAVRAEGVDLLGAGDAEVLLDLDRMGDVEAQAGHPGGSRAHHAGADEIASCQVRHVASSLGLAWVGQLCETM